jgi:hypothetical protein
MMIGLAASALMFPGHAAAWDGGSIDDRYPNIVWDIDADDDIELMLEAVATMQMMVDRYLPGQMVTFETVILDHETAIAAAYGRDVELAERYASDPAVVRMAVVGDVAAGYHPPIGSCTPIEFVIIHEMAHVMDNAHGRIASGRLNTIQPNDDDYAQLSGYSFNDDGTSNGPEMLANAVASVICNGGNPTERIVADLVGVS